MQSGANATVLQNSSVILEGGAEVVVSASSGGAGFSHLTFSGGTLTVNGASLNDKAPVEVSSGFIIGSGSLTLTGFGINSTEDLFKVADGSGFDYTVISGSGSGDTSKLTVSKLTTSEIKNTVTDASAVAYAVWGNSTVNSDLSSGLGVHLQLSEIQLASTSGGGLRITGDGRLDVKVSNHENTAGDITFESGSISFGHADSDYTGHTFVNSEAVITLTADKALGDSELVVSGGAVDFNGKKQSIGSLTVATSGALVNSQSGSGSLTIGLTGEEKTSYVNAASSGFNQAVTIANGHTLNLNVLDGLGSGALTVSGALALGYDGKFDNVLLGQGTVQIGATHTDAGTSGVASGSVALGSGNSGFEGMFSVQNGWDLSASASGNMSHYLGSSTLVVDSSATAHLSDTNSNGWTLSNKVSGGGTIVLSASGNSTNFGFAKDVNAGFSGTFVFGNLKLDLTSADNDFNVEALAGTTSRLNDGAFLFVDETVSVDTNLISNRNSVIDLDGVVGIDNSTHAVLTVNSLTLSGGSVIVDTTDENGVAGGYVAENEVLSTSGNFVTLINSKNEISGSASDIANASGYGGSVVSEIRDEAYEAYVVVAKGKYGTGLTIGNNGHDLGILYALESIEIQSDQTLALSESGTLSAQLRDNGAGSLLISGTGDIVLDNEDNDYSGLTTVDSGAKLTAGSGALGQTSGLIVGGIFINSGANTVGGLTVNGGGSLNLGAELTVAQSVDATSSIVGSLKGSGALVLQAGTLDVSGGNSDYSGVVVLGSGAQSATLTANAMDSLGGKEVQFGNSGSSYQITASGAGTLGQVLTGQGTLSIDLGGSENVFQFNADQPEWNGTLSLSQARFELYAPNAVSTSGLSVVLNSDAYLAVNTSDNAGDRGLGGLTLSGGTVDFGAVTDTSGQLNLSGGGLTVGGESTIVVSGSGSNALSASGSELLSGGTLQTVLFENVGSVTQDDVDKLILSGANGSVVSVTQLQNGQQTQVANITRSDAKLVLDSGNKTLSLSNAVSQIELLQSGSEAVGLVIEGSGSGSELTALVTGSGNITLGELSLSNGENSYTGVTNVKGNVWAKDNNVFGQSDSHTSLLDIDAGASVDIGSTTQYVGGLAGSGSLSVSAGGALNVWTASNLDVGNALNLSSGSVVNIKGQGTNSIDVHFSAASGGFVEGSLLSLENAALRFENLTSSGYTYVNKGNLALNDNASLTIYQGETAYELGDLTLSGGSLAFGNVSIDTGTESSAILSVGQLDISSGGSLSVAANVGETFNALTDEKQYSKVLIAFDSLVGDAAALNVADESQLTSSAIKNKSDGPVVAHAYWTGTDVKVNQLGQSGGSISLNYALSSIALADESGSGYVLDASNIEGGSGNLAVTITDYTDEGGNKYSGNITFAGGTIYLGNTATGNVGNTYTGTTYVSGGKLVLQQNNALGMSELDISGGAVDFNGKTQSIGSLTVASSGVLINSQTGAGSLTIGLTGEEKTSYVNADSTGFKQAVTIADGHTLNLNALDGLGSSALTVSGTLALGQDGTFDNAMLGQGTVQIGATHTDADTSGAASGAVALGSGNSGFGGTFSVQNGWTLSADGKLSDVLGSAALEVEQGGSAFLKESGNGSGAWNLSNQVTVQEDATLTVDGTNFENFVFGNADSAIKGGLNLVGMSLELTDGNASVLYRDEESGWSADVELSSGAQLVMSNSADRTLGTLSWNDSGNSLVFGSLGTTQTLHVEGVSGSGALNIDVQTTSGGKPPVAGSMDQSEVLASQKPNSETSAVLISSSGAMSLDSFELVGDSGNTAKFNITSGSGTVETVAVGTMGYDLALTDDNKNLVIAYVLQQVDIQSGKSLVLTESGSLGALVTGSGNLEIGMGGEIELTNAGNNYSGTTTVYLGSLTAQADTLGAGDLTVYGSNAKTTLHGSHVLSKANVISGGSLFVDGSVSLNQGIGVVGQSTLEIAQSGLLTLAGTSTIENQGVLSGSGTLTIASGADNILNVSGGNADFVGTVHIESGAQTNVNDLESLGKGTVQIDSGAAYHVALKTSPASDTVYALGQIVSGSGELSIDLGRKEFTDDTTNYAEAFFAFASEQDEKFDGTLKLASGAYSLASGSDTSKIAQNLDFELGNAGHLYVSLRDAQDYADKTIGSLTMASGSVVYFGGLRYNLPESEQLTSGGQLHVEGDLKIETSATVVLGTGSTSNVSVSGAELFAADDGVLIDLINVTGTLEGVENLDYKIVNSGAAVTITQNRVGGPSEQVAEVTRTFGDIVLSDSGKTVSLEYSVSQINLLATSGQGLVLNNAGSNAETLTSLISGSGNISFAGGTILLGNATQENTYTGTTYVSGGKLVLQKNNALGTSELVVSGGAVDFNGKTQSIGSLTVTSGALVNSQSGSGSLTIGLSGEAKTSDVNVASADFNQAVTIAGGHTLNLNAVDGLGVGSLTVNGTLKIGVDDSGFGNLLSGGSGIVALVSGADVELANASNNFSGTFSVGSGTSLVAEGDTADKLGSATLSVANGGSVILSEQGDLALGNKLTGDGTLIARNTSGAQADFSFANVKADGENFTGTLKLENMALSLGEQGDKDASHLSGARVELSSGSTLEVTGEQTLAGLNTNTSSNDNKLVFAGELGFGTFDGQVGTLTLTGSGSSLVGADIVIAAPSDGSATASWIGEANVISTAAQAQTHTLVDADFTADDLSDITLNGNSGAVTQVLDIRDADDTTIVADGTYAVSLVHDSGNGNLDISYALQSVSIRDGQTLTLSGDQNLQELKIGVHGNGDLAVSGYVTLNGQVSDYSGSTTVLAGATLTAGEHGLGETSKLNIESGAAATIAGANTVGALNVVGGGSLNLASELTVASGGAVSGSLSGSGAMTLQNGTLEVISANESFEGTVTVNSGAAVTMSSGDGWTFGSGTVQLDSGSRLTASNNGSGAYVLTSLLKGEGEAEFELNSGSFSFGHSGQDSSFAGDLKLASGNVTLDATGNSGAFANAALTLDGMQAQLNQAGLSDQNIRSLTLNDSTIDFGSVAFDNTSGRIVTQSLTIGGVSGASIELALQETTDAKAVFDNQKTVQLVSGLGTDVDLNALKLVQATENQSVKQDKKQVANLTYAGSGFSQDNGVLSAVYGLTGIELLDDEGSFDVVADGVSDATITAQITGSGNIAYTSGSLAIKNANNVYKGKTLVEGAAVSLLSNNALGETSALEITSGSVAFGTGTTQTVGSLNVTAQNGLTGAGTLKVTSGGSVSSSNSGYEGSLVLFGTDLLTLSAESALGTAVVDVSGGSTLALAFSGGFANTLSGSGTVSIVSGFAVQLTGNGNSGYQGTFAVESGAVFEASSSSNEGLTDVLGGSTLAVTGDFTLNLESGAFTMEQKLKGEGSVTVKGSDSETTLAFANMDNAFNGSMRLEFVGVTLEDVTATTLKETELELGSGSTLTVATADDKASLSSLATESGSTLVFAGTGGQNLGSDKLGQLQVGSLDISSGGTVRVDFSVSSDQTVGSALASEILTADEGSIEQMLVWVSGENISGSADNLTLDAVGSKQALADIVDGQGATVAVGTYDYQLATNEDGLGLSFTLTEVDLQSGKTLELAGADNSADNAANTLSALITGPGGLSVIGNTVYLTHTGESQSDYTGETSIAAGASLHAVSGALGNTSALTVAGSYVNEGDNAVGRLTNTGTLKLDADLTVNGGNSTLEGTLEGSGALTFVAGDAVVSGLNASGYSGLVAVKESGSMSVNGLGVGTGILSVGGAVTLTSNVGGTLQNTVSGGGTLTLAASGQAAFDFKDAGSFEGQVVLQQASMDLSKNTNASALSQAGLALESAILTVNGNDVASDKTLTSLAVDGGSTLAFGNMGLDAGQIGLSGGKLTIEDDATITVTSELADLTDENGSASLVGSIAPSLTLVTGAGEGSTVGNVDFNSGTSSFTQNLVQNETVVAKIHGAYEDVALDGSDLKVGLAGSVLELIETYTVTQTGELELDVSGSGTLAVQGSESNRTALKLSGNNENHDGVMNVGSFADLTFADTASQSDKTELVVAAGGTVAFGDDSGSGTFALESVTSSGALSLAADSTLVIEKTSSIAGASSRDELKGTIQFEGDTLTLGHAQALGSASLEWSGKLVLSAIAGEAGAVATFDNQLSGSGAALSIESGSNVALQTRLEGVNALAVTGSSSASMKADNLLASTSVRIDEGSLFALQQTASGEWTLANELSGEGVAALSAEQAVDLNLDTSLGSGFSGTLEVGSNLSLALNAEETTGNYDSLKKSSLSTLSLSSGGTAVLTGNVNLESKSVHLGEGGNLVFTGLSAPGNGGTNVAGLTVGKLALDSGFRVSVDVGGDAVNATGLFAHDQSQSVNVITYGDLSGDVSTGRIELAGSNNDEAGNLLFDVKAGGDKVALGHYGFELVNDSSENNISIRYQLEEIETSSQWGILTLSAVGDDDELDARLTGDGRVAVSGTVTLAEASANPLSGDQGGDDRLFEGTIAVSEGAELHVKENALGMGTLELSGTDASSVYIDESNTIGGLRASGESNMLQIGSTDSQDVVLDLYGTGNEVTRAQILGSGTLRVHGDDEDGSNLDIELTTIVGNNGFTGDFVLQDIAVVNLSADHSKQLQLFSAGSVQVESGSVFNMEFAQPMGSSLQFGKVLKGEGTVSVTMGDTSDRFYLSASQQSGDFAGTFEIRNGTFELGSLYTTDPNKSDALANATLALGAGAMAIFNEGDAANAQGVTVLGGLQLVGGTLDVGVVGYGSASDGHTIPVASTIDLNGGTLTLNKDAGSTIELGVSSEPVEISATGTGLLRVASEGSQVTIVENIGSMQLEGGNDASDLRDYITVQAQSSGTQLLEQELGDSGDPELVAESTRTYSETAHYASGSLSVGIGVEQLGLLRESTSADDWQGLTLTAAVGENLELEANLTNGSAGQKGNIVYKGASGGSITLAGDNTYEGRTWLTDGASIEFGKDNGFGNTSALRVDSGSSVDFGEYDQVVGSLYADGEGALASTNGAELTITGEAEILGANTALSGTVTFRANATIGSAQALGGAYVNLSGVDSTLTVQGAEGELSNQFAGGASTSLALVSGSEISLETSQLENFSGSLSVSGSSELDLTVNGPGSVAVQNAVSVASDSTLSVGMSSSQDNFSLALGTRIEGTLYVENAGFNVTENADLLSGANLVAGSGGRVSVDSSIGSETIDNLTLQGGSILEINGVGTPGSVNSSAGHIDLGESGSFAVGGQVTVKLDVGKVNADLEEIQDGVGNKPLTAYDVLADDASGKQIANLVSAGFVNNDNASIKLELTGEGNFDNNALKVGIYNSADDREQVAVGTFDYKVTLDEDGLNLSYGLTQVDVSGGKALALVGYENPEYGDNTLSITVAGDGGLLIDRGTITLTGKNSYKGATTVAAGATLVTGQGSNSLGGTSALELLDDGQTGAKAEINGTEEVGSLSVSELSTLALGASSSLTLANASGKTSTIAGSLEGAPGVKLTVLGNSANTDPDLVVSGANKNYLGDVSLVSGAYVRLESVYALGSQGEVDLSSDSTLEIYGYADDAQIYQDENATYRYHQFKNLITGDGTVTVNLENSDDIFAFLDQQYQEANRDAFNGTFNLVNGTFKFSENLDTEVFKNVHVMLGGEGATLDISSSNTEVKDRLMNGLTMAGGTLVFGSLSIDREHAKSKATLIDLGGGALNLTDPDEQVEIVLRQDATNLISDLGSEVVNASDSDGSRVVLIHNIGSLNLDGEEFTVDSTDSSKLELLNEYFKHELLDVDDWQVLEQSIGSVNGVENHQEVARVQRKFGDFGYMNDEELGNSLYLGYEINSIELLYPGSTNEAAYGENAAWKGLTVSTTDSATTLGAYITGQGNLVITGGEEVLSIGNDANAEDNDYTGRTWVTGNAKVQFVDDNAFGKTSDLRIDTGSSVDIGEYSQTVGTLTTFGKDALIGSGVITVTDDAEIHGVNENFTGSLKFEQKGEGVVNSIQGLGSAVVDIGGNYHLTISDSGELKNAVSGAGELQIGSKEADSSNHQVVLAGDNNDFSGTISVIKDWTLGATVEEGEKLSNRLGTGELKLENGATADVDFANGSALWDHKVTGGGTLVVSADDNQQTLSIKDEDVLSDFDGTFVVGGGRLDLASNADKLGSSDLQAQGSGAAVVVAGDDPVTFDRNLTIDGGTLAFEDEIAIGTDTPELEVGGILKLTGGAQVNIKLDKDLNAEGPGGSLDMSAITMADEGALQQVIAEAYLVELGSANLVLDKSAGGSTHQQVSINDGDQQVAVGTYDFGLGVSADRSELGLSYQLVEVDVLNGQTLDLTGAVSGETSGADWDNASQMSANIVGEGGLSLVKGELTLTGANNAYAGATTVASGAVLTVQSSLGQTSGVTIADGGRLVNDSDKTTAGHVNVAGTLELEEDSMFELKESGSSTISGTLVGSGGLKLEANASATVDAAGSLAFIGTVQTAQGARYELLARSESAMTVASNFADSGDGQAGAVRFDKAQSVEKTEFVLKGSAKNFTGTFELVDGVTVSFNDIAAIGGEDSTLKLKADDNAQATVRFDYDDELVGQNDWLDVTQQMNKGIAFEKTGSGVLALSDDSLGAGSVLVAEGGVLFGASGSDVYGTALTVDGDGAWAAGFGGLTSLAVGENSTFYVGGRAGYNGLVGGSGDKTTTFTVEHDVHNDGIIVVGGKTDKSETPSDEAYIGNKFVIEGDYVTDGGVLDLNAVIAGDDKSKADHVTITGGIEGHGYVDVNIDKTASTGGTLKYLGLVSVGKAEDPNNLSLKLKDEVKIGNLWYALMYSTDKREYYLESSATDPGTDPWDPNEREDVAGATVASLAFLQAQTFDLSLHDHVGETTYVDPITGEVRRTSFWMVQKGDWTRFSNDSGQIDTDGHTFTTHLGTDIYAQRMDTVTHRFGVLASFADGSYDVTSGVTGKATKASFRGYSAGLYWAMTPETESGPFAGMQLRWNKFDNELSGEGSHDYDVSGLSITAELGWDQLMSRGLTNAGRTYEWRLEPHVRFYWSDFGDVDSWTSGEDSYKVDNDNGLLIRLGARTKYAIYNGDKGRTPAVQTYAEANWVFNNSDFTTSTTNPYTTVESTQSGSTFGEFRVGVEAQFNKNVNVWLEGHHQNGSNDFESTGVMAGFKYSW